VRRFICVDKEALLCVRVDHLIGVVSLLARFFLTFVPSLPAKCDELKAMELPVDDGDAVVVNTVFVIILMSHSLVHHQKRVVHQ
jgi:hypothetical protein